MTDVNTTAACTINRLERYRRLTTRYEKQVDTYAAIVAVACILGWFYLYSDKR